MCINKYFKKALPSDSISVWQRSIGGDSASLPGVVSRIRRAEPSAVCRRRGACLRLWRCQRGSAGHRCCAQHDRARHGGEPEKASRRQRADTQARRWTQGQACFRCLSVIRSQKAGCSRYAGRSDADLALDLEKPAPFIPGLAPARAHRVSPCGLPIACANWVTACRPTVKSGKAASTWIETRSLQYLNDQAAAFLKAGQPVISVDTKKKELIGNYKNDGRESAPSWDAGSRQSA